MKAEIEVEKPDSVLLTVSVTMTIGEWREVHKSLLNRGQGNGNYWPVGAYAVLIGRAIEKIDTRISERETQTV